MERLHDLGRHRYTRRKATTGLDHLVREEGRKRTNCEDHWTSSVSNSGWEVVDNEDPSWDAKIYSFIYDSICPGFFHTAFYALLRPT